MFRIHVGKLSADMDGSLVDKLDEDVRVTTPEEDISVGFRRRRGQRRRRRRQQGSARVGRAAASSEQRRAAASSSSHIPTQLLPTHSDGVGPYS